MSLSTSRISVARKRVEQWRAWFSYSCAFVVAVFALTACGYPLIHDGQIDPKQAASVEAGVARLRELDYTRQVPVVLKSPNQARQAIIAQIARDHSDEDLKIGGESGVMTGLYPPGTDLKRQTLELLSNEVIGFYNPDTKQMVIVQRSDTQESLDVKGPGRGMGAMVLAHELTHALQDQHFGIEKMLHRVKDNDDQTLALKCVAEGDATLIGFGYIAGHLESANVEFLVNQMNKLSPNSVVHSHDIPRAITVPMLFQYSGGSRFVAEAWRRGGWPAVDRLYRDPPLSSQQIMQPELYFDHPTPPVHIYLRGYEDLLRGWTKVDDDTYGELLLKLILESNLPPQAPAFATLPRWAGDRIITLKQGKELTLLWLIAFHDQPAARQFAEAYSRILDHLGAQSNPHGIATREAAVFVAIGPGAKDFARLRPAIWKASRISPVPSTEAVDRSTATSSGRVESSVIGG